MSIVLALIAGIVALVTAYWQFVYKPSSITQFETIKYSGRVIDSSTKEVIPGAKVSIDTQGAPQVYYSDSDGVFYLQVPGSSQTAQIRVEANGYETFNRNVFLSRTGLEDVRLNQSAPTNQNSSAGRSSKKRASKNKQDQIDRILSSEPSNKPN